MALFITVYAGLMNVNIIKSFLGCSRKSDITMYANGRIDITARIASYLGIQPGDVIDIIRSDDNEYYLYVKHKRDVVIGRHKGRCAPTNKGRSQSYRTYCKDLTSPILEDLNADKAHLMAGELTTFDNIGKAVTIITHNL